MEKTKKKKYIGIAILIVVFVLLIKYSDQWMQGISVVAKAILPIILGLGIGYVVNILMSFYERQYVKVAKSRRALRAKRPWCMLLAYCSVAAIIIAVVMLVIPELTACVKLLIDDTPDAMNNLVETLKSNSVTKDLVVAFENRFLGDAATVTEKVTQIIDAALNGVGQFMNVIGGALKSVFSFVAAFVVGIVFSFYILAGKEKLKGQCKTLLRTYLPKANDKILYVLRVFNQSFHRFIVGQCVEAVILGVLCIIGMAVFRFPYAVMIGALIGFMALIPIAGAYIGAIVGALMILTVSPMKALLFLIFLVVLQQIEGNVIYPKVVGGSIGLPGIWVLAAVIVGGSVFGVFGMLVAVPITAAVYQLIRANVAKRANER